jgi:hypothetical protein
VGDSVVPLILRSDGIVLWNIGGNQNQWPEYWTIGYLSSEIRQIPSIHSLAIAALLPIAIMVCKIPEKWLDEQQQRNREVLNEVL